MKSQDDDLQNLQSACGPRGSNSLTLTGQASYVCHDPFKAQVTFTNETCATVGVGETLTVLDLTGNKFCCLAPGPCPDPMECDETYTLTAQSAAGDISKTESVHLSLGGCTEVCP